MVTTVEAPQGPQTLLATHEIAKSFGATRAVVNASVELRAGEVHVLVGENGCGKSTLIKILSGVHAPDSGTVTLGGESAPAIRSPRAAYSAGIATVFQEVLVAESRSVLDNVWLGSETLLRSPLSRRQKRARASEVLDELLGREVDLDTPVERLSLSDRQTCGIARSLLRRPKVLILDEATSALDVATRDRLFELLVRMGRQGAGIIFITHRMDEIMATGDRITVMRSGSTVATLNRGEASPSELVRLMTGAGELTANARRMRQVDSQEKPLLRVEGVVLEQGRSPIDLDIHSGQLVGVAGLEGHGQEAFLDVLRGVQAVAGTVTIRGANDDGEQLRSPRRAAAQGIAYVPRERRQALFSWMSIFENFGMPTLGRDAPLGWLSSRRTRARFAKYTQDLGISLGRSSDRITTLSGGNQQKVVIARWLAAHPRLLLLNDPTRGIDVGAKRDLYRLLAGLSAEGLTIVMLSTELDEHVELMDRVLVFRERELFCELTGDGLSRDGLVAAFFGQTSQEVHDGSA